MEVIDNLHVDVQYGKPVGKRLVVVVVGGDGQPLFKSNWLKYIQLDWNHTTTYGLLL